MAFCLPRVQGRGAGLGNELITWGKAYLASRALGLRLLHPAWGLNPRGYAGCFGTSRIDWVGYRALTALLPTVRFNEEDYRRTGESDFGLAVRNWAQTSGVSRRTAFVLQVEGMWGGYYAIRHAKHFILSQLMSCGDALGALLTLQRRLRDDCLHVAVHVRRGDFRPADPKASYQGVFNRAIPGSWFNSTCRQLRAAFGAHVQFILLADSTNPDVAALAESLGAIVPTPSPCPGGDLLNMTAADLLICSVSSFSLWGVVLSGAPYIWYRPQLSEQDGLLSIWGHEPTQQTGDSVSDRNRRWVSETEQDSVLPRGIALDDEDELPAHVLEYLRLRLMMKRPETDLVHYGVIPSRVRSRPANAQGA
jgi:hypothetical protein